MGKWDLWASSTPELRGANVFQKALDGSWCSDFGRTFLQQLKDAGANYVNFSVPGTYNVVPPDPHVPAFGELPAARDRLNQLLQWADETGLYSVISFRSGPGRSESDIVPEKGVRLVRDLFISRSAQDAFVEMWRTVAARYNRKPSVAAYDLLVEPHKAESPGEPLPDYGEFLRCWRKIAARTVDVIRRVDTETPIIVGVTEYSAFSDLANWEPLFPHDERNEKRIVYGIHQYAPFEYTHDPQSMQYDPALIDLRKSFDYVDHWRLKYPNYNAAFAVNEFGIVVTRPDACGFLEAELTLLHGHRGVGSAQRGMSYAAWLWEEPEGKCYDGKMSLSANAKFLLTLRERGWQRPSAG